jgi:hypothetical protein
LENVDNEEWFDFKKEQLENYLKLFINGVVDEETV